MLKYYRGPGTGVLAVVGAIKGLSSERDKVREALLGKESPRWDTVALSISPEELAGLRAYSEGKVPDDFELTDYEFIYARNLRRFGEVEYPPPCYTEALKVSQEKSFKLSAIDLDEESFTNAYCAYITGTQLLRHSLRKSLVKRAAFRSRTPEEFVGLWDARMNQISGFRRLEDRREEHMAKKLADLVSKTSSVVAVVEYERAKGVIDRLHEHDLRDTDLEGKD